VDDIVIVKITTDTKEGDVISYISESSVVTHRIVSIEGDKIVTKGDANNANDEPIERKDVIGKVVHVAARLGKFKKVVSEPIVYISFFVTFILFSIYFNKSGEESK
ncbi:MAG: signal peptidase I, partial [Bacilli bacterium]|nr:signal peptidase I [Bacilli bacterium]